MRDKWLTGLAETGATLATVTIVAHAVHLNPASAGFLFLVAVLFIASRYRLAIGTIASVAAMLCYNFFFFPPKRTFAVEDPANWIALGSFLLTALLANRLLANQKREAESARVSRQEVEALYAVSVDLLKTTGGVAGIGEAVARWIHAIGAASGGVILFGASPQHQDVLAWTGAPMSDEIEEIVAGVGRHKRYTELPSRFGTDVCAPLGINNRIAGALVLRGARVTRNAIESVAALTAQSVERERFLADRAHVEALRESNELRSSLLQAVAHDLNSPLTVLTVESDALARKGGAHADAARHVEVIREQLAHLKRRIESLLALARVEAGLVHPRVEPTPAADLFRAARENLATVVASRTIRTSIDADAPDALVDPSLALEMVVNLVENAHRASPPGSEIELRSQRSPDDATRVWLEVLDRGNGLSPSQERALKTVGLADSDRGIGMDLARTLAQLNAGSVEWFPREGGGTIARIDLPAAGAS